ncbi:MAG: helix-turn-helix domain-containing protein [Pseudomonadota bacterium]
MRATARKPRQDRAVKTEQALLDALEALLEQVPFAEVTVAKVATAAGVTTGAIYRRFEDKEALLRGAFQRFLERTRADAALRLSEAPDLSDRDILRVAVDRTIDFTLANAPLMRAASQLDDPRSFELLQTARNLAADDVAARLSGAAGEDAERQGQVRFFLRIITAAARDTFLAGPAARAPGVSVEAYRAAQRRQLATLREQLLEMGCAYLGARP